MAVHQVEIDAEGVVCALLYAAGCRVPDDFDKLSKALRQVAMEHGAPFLPFRCRHLTGCHSPVLVECIFTLIGDGCVERSQGLLLLKNHHRGNEVFQRFNEKHQQALCEVANTLHSTVKLS